MQDVGQRCLDQLPAGDALNGLRQGWGETMQLILHQNPLKGLGKKLQEEGRNKQTNRERSIQREGRKTEGNEQVSEIERLD